jgi:hypothetical protein
MHWFEPSLILGQPWMHWFELSLVLGQPWTPWFEVWMPWIRALEPFDQALDAIESRIARGSCVRFFATKLIVFGGGVPMKATICASIVGLGWLVAGCSSGNGQSAVDGAADTARDSLATATTASDSSAADSGVGADTAGGADTASATKTDAATASDSTTKTDAATASDAATEASTDTGAVDSKVDAAIDAGTLWLPTSAGPIHFHWMIGGFTTADILGNQNGPTVYDIDGEGATAADVAAIHAAGAKAVCYVDVGSLEKGRSDYSQFPASVVGPVMSGWPNENWLLVTAANQATILPLMQARFRNWCQAKGFDAIEPDNLDAWANNIAGISQADNVAYDLAIAGLAHGLSMSIGLKNVATDVTGTDLTNFVSTFDWALNEQCYENSECGVYSQAGSFIAQNKAVFDVEYNTQPTCTAANAAHMNAQFTDLDLVGATDTGYIYTPCVADSSSVW